MTQMPYIDAVIKECLRLHDPATLLFRRALQDIAVGENLVIPKVSSLSSPRFMLSSPRWLSSCDHLPSQSLVIILSSSR